jgi:type IV secretory pathway VirB9-like protein
MHGAIMKKQAHGNLPALCPAGHAPGAPPGGALDRRGHGGAHPAREHPRQADAYWAHDLPGHRHEPAYYLLELSSMPQDWMDSASRDYPKDRTLALQKQVQQAQACAPIETGLTQEQIRFRYAVSGDNPPWTPLRVFDGGERVYIQFPAGIAQGELPPLFVIGPQGDEQLVNYRFRAPYYVVDRLFGAAELKLGGAKAQVVRIERTDGMGATPRR